MDIDVQGAAQVRACREGILPQCYADVYIYVPQEELKNRLCGRQTVVTKPSPYASAMRNRKTPACRSSR